MTAIWLAAFSIAALSSNERILQTSWENYSPEGGNFKILLPGKPKESSQTTKTAIGEVKVFSATYSNGDGDILMVSYSDLPEGSTKPDNLEPLFDGVREGAKGKDGTVLDSKERDLVSMKIKFQGREFHLDKQKGKQKANLWVIVSGQRLYQVAAIGSMKFINGKDPEKFFNSFNITSK